MVPPVARMVIRGSSLEALVVPWGAAPPGVCAMAQPVPNRKRHAPTVQGFNMGRSLAVACGVAGGVLEVHDHPRLQDADDVVVGGVDGTHDQLAANGGLHGPGEL